MELSSLLHDLHLSSFSEKPRPSPPLPAITELLSRLQEKLIGAPSESSSLIGQVEQLFQAADPNWLFSLNSANQEDGWTELQAAHGCLINALIGCAALPLCKDNCRSLNATAYQNVLTQAVAVSSALTALLGTLGNWERGGGARADSRSLLQVVAPPICVFAVTHFQDQMWTNSSSRAAAQRLQEALLRAGDWRDSAHLLMGDDEGRSRGIVGGVLDILQPQMTKNSWQQCEAVKLVFAWTLLQVTRPSLSHHLPRLLPPSLLLSDHYRPENCMLGVRCLHHIVLNTPAAELRQFNRAEVLYQALFKHLYTSEATVIQLVLSCLLDLLLVLEKPPSLLGPSSTHDTHMEAEHKVELRRVYAAALPGLIDRMGVAVCRHLQRVERVVLGYLEVSDPPEETSRLNILEVLERSSRAAWPRMRRRVPVLLRCLLRLLVDVSEDSQLADSARTQLMDRTAACIKLMDACCHGNIQHLLRQVDSSCCSAEVLGCLATVTMTAER
ncbi:TELO2-interacting protein 2 isoform X2 [Brachyistius frenatus]|uniref:TELO2-interacting protein 2 isoform X2 n=1 Tax=Brachyistius frenatus TaxID=100188 RepID=UPI0037E91EE1